ncbi:MAG: hypothetical protein FDZ69_00325 [Deltaproteobacteria bacterium]|nr:MAG: hypothetical protein FDZ69_00325 [Deltaproteobacteria bacterium]
MHLRISATLLVDHVLIEELYGCTEFHADVLAQGLCGDLLPLQLYCAPSDRDEIARVKELLAEGNLLVIRDQTLNVQDNLLRIMSPELHLYEGDVEKVRKEFLWEKERRDKDSGKISSIQGEKLRGRVTEMKLMSTKNAGAMAVATVETTEGKVDALLFPSVLTRNLLILSRLGFMEFFGELQEKEEDAERSIFVVEQVVGP